MPAWFDGLLLGYEARFLAGAWLTAQLALASFALAVSIGMVGAIGKLSRVKALSGALSIYTLIVRGAPELLLILLIYFDLQHLLNAARDALGYSEVWIISPFWAGVAGIGVIYGAYMTETFRGAMLATPTGLAEAGRAFGMNAWSVFWRIVFPQMMRHALPGLRNNWQVLLKATALVSVIGLADDMMSVASQARARTREPFLFYGAVAGGYLLFTLLSAAVFSFCEKRARRGAH